MDNKCNMCYTIYISYLLYTRIIYMIVHELFIIHVLMYMYMQ